MNNCYKIIRVIGQGAYGEINLAEDLKHRQSPHSHGAKSQGHSDDSLAQEIQKMVAIKKMKIDDKVGIEQTTIRELKILEEIKHPNVIGLRDVFAQDNLIYLVLDYMVCDLGKLIDSKNVSLNH